MKSFFKTMLASMLGFILFTILCIFLFLGLVGGVVASLGSQQKAELTKPSILELRIDGTMQDRVSADPIEQLNRSVTNTSKPLGVNQILKALKKAKTDNNIKGILLYPGVSASISGSHVQEIRAAIEEFKQSGKFVYAYGNYYSTSAYWLSSVSDTICIQNEGSVTWQGKNLEMMFYKGLLDKLGVEMQITRHGKFKSAVEPYIQTQMSEENRKQYEMLTQSVWDVMLKDVAEGRNMSVKDANKAADEMYGMFAKDALQHGLVDMVAPYGDFEKLLMVKMGAQKQKDLEIVSVTDYASIPVVPTKTKDKVAVIYANGEIGIGKGDNGSIGTENISKALKKAAEDEDVKAIVLRVNSPGGAVLTSDIIYWDVLAAKAKKPVIASFGSYAASGGYYISCGTDYIFAQPTTLTGSIGVFGMLPNFDKLAKKVGITFDEVNTNSNSGYPSFRRPMTKTEKELMQRNIENIYANFIGLVAKGRGMSTEAIDSIGQGRVWSGVDGLRIGLVDELGGLSDAIAYAAKKADIKEYNIVDYPKQKSTYEILMDNFASARSRTLFNAIESYVGSENAYLLEAARNVNEQGKQLVMARMPYGVIWE